MGRRQSRDSGLRKAAGIRDPGIAIPMHNISRWPNLRHFGEPLGGAESLLEAVSFKKAMESMGRGRVMSKACHDLILVAVVSQLPLK